MLGNYKEAISAFRKILDYSDAYELLVKCQILQIANAKLNDTVSFGYYEQDSDIGNGKEVLMWNVVIKEEDRVLLWSDKIVDYQRFNTITRDSSGYAVTEPYISWKDSHMRSWLNGEFYNEAFGDKEKPYVISLSHETTDCEKNTYTTEEKVFLFSSQEFYDLKGMTVGTMTQIATKYAHERVKYEECWNSCYTRDQQEWKGIFGISDVFSPGVIDNHNKVYFMNASSQIGAVRPCVWVDISDKK